MVDSNDKRRARLNCISHLLSQVPYEEVPREPVKFPKRQSKGDYVEPDYPYRMVPAIYRLERSLRAAAAKQSRVCPREIASRPSQ